MKKSACAVGANAKKSALSVCHANLERQSSDSPYPVLCPVCEEGILLVTRHQQTLRLLNRDRCTHCGQQVRYTDRFIGEEMLVDPGEKAN